MWGIMTRNFLSMSMAAAVITVFPLGAAAHAQAQAPTREELKPGVQPEADRKASAQIDQSGAFTPGPCPLADSDLRTAIHEVRFTDQGGAPLAPELARLLTGISTGEEEQSVKVICELRDRGLARLRAARYVASVQIPQQRIDEGVLRLEVVSGRIVEVHVRGDAGPYENLLKGRIEALKALNPLNEADAERILLLANDVPGLKVQLGLAPTGGRPGDLIGELNINYRAFSLIGNVQNYNSTQLGRETIYLRGEYFGLTGAGDRTFVGVSGTAQLNEQKILQVGHSMTLGGSGTQLSWAATIAESRPDLKTLNLRTRSLISMMEISQPLKRSVPFKMTSALGLEISEQRTRVYSSDGKTSNALNLDRISTVYARIDAEARKLRFDGSQASSISASLELRKGLGIFGATKTGVVTAKGYSPSRFEGHATATVVRGELNGVIGFGPIFELAATARGQWADKPLLNYDEFAIGNLTLGRGYDPGANTGDRRIGGTVEARAHVPLGQKLRGTLFGFYDGVQLWNLDTGSTEAKRYLASVGGGVSLTYNNAMRLDVTYAHPMDPPLLTGVNIKPPADRVLLRLTAQLVPFGPNR